MTKRRGDTARAARMFSAVQGLEAHLTRRVTLEELGQWVAEREGRPDKPYAGSVVRRWLKGLSEPRGTGGWRALGEVLRVDPGWLAFGTGTTSAPALIGRGAQVERPPATNVPLSAVAPVPPPTPAERVALRKGGAASKKGRRRSGGAG